MVRFNCKKFIYSVFLIFAGLICLSCNNILADLLDDKGSIDVGGVISAKDSGTLISTGIASFSFTLPENNAPIYSVNGVNKKGYKLNLSTTNLASSFKYKLSSSDAYTVCDSNWKNEFLVPGTYSVVFSNDTKEEVSYSVQFDIYTNWDYLNGGGAVFDSIQLTKDTEDNPNVEIVNIKVGNEYTSSLDDFTRLNLSAANIKIYEFTVKTGEMLNLMYKDSRAESASGLSEPFLERYIL